MDKWEVICGNIGSVYSGNSRIAAEKAFLIYVEQSKSNVGRAGGEDVTLMEHYKNGSDIRKEHIGQNNTVDEI